MRAFTFVFALAASQLLSLVPADAKLHRKTSSAVTSDLRDTSLDATAILSARQHHEPRKILDVCAYIDTDSILGGGLLGIPIHDLLGLDLCLCLSALPLDLTANAKLRLLGEKYGSALVNAVLALLINTNHNSRQCRYPDHSTPLCSASDPCGFMCQAPYTECDGQCVCEAPYTSCNGQCGMFPRGCGSAVPYAPNANSLYKRNLSPAQRAQSSCRLGESVCGVYGSPERMAFECIDTHTNLESCGGCVYPNPFLFNDVSTATAKDCSAIEGAVDVSCFAGSCLVESCAEGWALNESKGGCVESPLAVQHPRRVASRVFVEHTPHDNKGEPVKEDEMHKLFYSSAYY